MSEHDSPEVTERKKLVADAVERAILQISEVADCIQILACVDFQEQDFTSVYQQGHGPKSWRYGMVDEWLRDERTKDHLVTKKLWNDEHET